MVLSASSFSHVSFNNEFLGETVRKIFFSAAILSNKQKQEDDWRIQVVSMKGES